MGLGGGKVSPGEACLHSIDKDARIELASGIWTIVILDSAGPSVARRSYARTVGSGGRQLRVGNPHGVKESSIGMYGDLGGAASLLERNGSTAERI